MITKNLYVGSFFLGFISFGFAQSAEAASYYASPSGYGATCSSAAPCALNTGLTKAIAGDELVLKNGTYNTWLDTRNDGVTIRAEQKHQATISYGQSTPLGGQIVTVKNNNITISGLRIDGQRTAGSRVGLVRFYTSNGVVIEDNIIENAAGGLVCIGGSVTAARISNVVFRNNLIQGSGFRVEYGEAVYIGKYDLPASTKQVWNVEFYRNTIRDFGENGFDLKPPTYDIRIHHNLIEGQIIKPAGRGNFGIIAMGGNTANVYENVLHNNMGGDSAIRTTAGGGNVFKNNVINGTMNTGLAIQTERRDIAGARTQIINNHFCNLSSTRVAIGNGVIIQSNPGLDLPTQNCLTREKEIIAQIQTAKTTPASPPPRPALLPTL